MGGLPAVGEKKVLSHLSAPKQDLACAEIRVILLLTVMGLLYLLLNSHGSLAVSQLPKQSTIHTAGIMGMRTKFLSAVVTTVSLSAALFSQLTAPANASVIFTWSGLSSAVVPVSFEADLTISGNTLTLVLMNNSPTNSLNPNDCLASFYFGIAGNPTLTYSTGVGAVYAGVQSGPDILIDAAEDLTSTTNNAGMADKWQFKTMNVAWTPFLAYGIGTVGNANLTNSFNGNQVDGLDLSIYRTEVTTANLNGKYLVKDTATFTFTGVSGNTEADISPTAAFGMGTAPDSLEIVPEPSSVALASMGLLGLLAIIRRRK